MISLEKDTSIENRVKWNRPYSSITVRMESAEDFIPHISRDQRYIIWFDYDYIINQSNLFDVMATCRELSPGSIFIVTVDAKPPEPLRRPPSAWRKYVQTELRDFLPDQYPPINLKIENTMSLSRDLILSAISKGLRSRPNVSFQPLWSIGYSDTRPMYTFGGMLATATEKRKLDSGCSDFYFRRNQEDSILQIEVPSLTRRERMVLDHYLPSGCATVRPDFGIKPEEVDAYRMFYRFFPSYSELF